MTTKKKKKKRAAYDQYGAVVNGTVAGHGGLQVARNEDIFKFFAGGGGAAQSNASSRWRLQYRANLIFTLSNGKEVKYNREAIVTQRSGRPGTSPVTDAMVLVINDTQTSCMMHANLWCLPVVEEPKIHVLLRTGREKRS